MEVRSYESGDEHGILDLFRVVFEIERSMEHWRWKFLANPMGRHITVAVTDDGKIVGQFAGLPVLAATAQDTFVLSQGIDHMVHPEFHKRGIFAAMTQHFLRTFVGDGREVEFYGYNLRRKHEIDKRGFAMELVHGVQALELDLGRPEPSHDVPPAWRRSRYAVTEISRCAEDVDELWRRFQSRVALAAVRDARYLNWRYADSPDVRYRIVAVRDRLTRRLAGVAVLRMGWFDEPVAAIVDWMIAREDQTARLVLLRACHELARDGGVKQMRIWLPPDSAEQRWFVDREYRVEDTPFLLSILAAGPADRLSLLRRSWYYTMGDSDIF